MCLICIAHAAQLALPKDIQVFFFYPSSEAWALARKIVPWLDAKRGSYTCPLLSSCSRVVQGRLIIHGWLISRVAGKKKICLNLHYYWLFFHHACSVQTWLPVALKKSPSCLKAVQDPQESHSCVFGNHIMLLINIQDKCSISAHTLESWLLYSTQ